VFLESCCAQFPADRLFGVTYPHKAGSVSSSVDRKTDRAARLGALNTIGREAERSLTATHRRRGDVPRHCVCRRMHRRGHRAHSRWRWWLPGKQSPMRCVCRVIAQSYLKTWTRASAQGREKPVRSHWRNVEIMPAGNSGGYLITTRSWAKTSPTFRPFTAEESVAARLSGDVRHRNGTTALIAESGPTEVRSPSPAPTWVRANFPCTACIPGSLAINRRQLCSITTNEEFRLTHIDARTW